MPVSLQQLPTTGVLSSVQDPALSRSSLPYEPGLDTQLDHLIRPPLSIDHCVAIRNSKQRFQLRNRLHFHSGSEA